MVFPQDYIDRYKPASDGSFELTTDYPDALPVLKFANNDSLRRRMYVAFWTRAFPKNMDVLKKIMQTRYETATPLGYHSWADYNAADKSDEPIACLVAPLRQLFSLASSSPPPSCTKPSPESGRSSFCTRCNTSRLRHLSNPVPCGRPS
jgi:Zn-dependent oligopeptidase